MKRRRRKRGLYIRGTFHLGGRFEPTVDCVLLGLASDLLHYDYLCVCECVREAARMGNVQSELILGDILSLKRGIEERKEGIPFHDFLLLICTSFDLLIHSLTIANQLPLFSIYLSNDSNPRFSTSSHPSRATRALEAHISPLMYVSDAS